MDDKRKRDEIDEISKKQAESMIEQRYEEGKKYIYPEMFAEWKKWLETMARDWNLHWEDVGIECLKRLENGEEFETVFEFVKNSVKINDSLLLARELFYFSKVGPEFYEYVYKKTKGVELSGEVLEVVQSQKEKNRKLAELHKSGREVSISEIGEVAKGVTLGSTTKAIDAVTYSKDDYVIENDGQSHNDE